MPTPNPLTAALQESARPSASRRPATAPAKPAAGTRLVGAHFPAPVLRQLRMLAAREERTVRSLLAEALNEIFAKNKLPPIA